MALIDEVTGTRYLCSILEDMRSCYNTRNFAHLLGLISEAQSRANRMENALETYGTGYDGVVGMEERRLKLKKEIALLVKEKEKLET